MERGSYEGGIGEFDIFISYSRVDKLFAQQLRGALEGEGLSVWMDESHIPLTENWRVEVFRGIEAAHNFLFIISPDSIQSDPCGMEIAHAAENNKRLVPVLHRNVQITAVNPLLRDLNFVIFEGRNFDQMLAKLVDALRKDLSYVKGHTRLLQRALEWQSKQRDASFLIRGRSLEEAEDWLTKAVTNEPKPSALQTEYITTSRQMQNQQQALELAREKRARRRLTTALLLMIAAFCTASVLGFKVNQESLAKSWALLSTRFAEFQTKIEGRNAKIKGYEAEVSRYRAEVAKDEALAAEAAAVEAKETAEAAEAIAEQRRREAEIARAAAETAETAERQQRQRAERSAIAALTDQTLALVSESEALLAVNQQLESLLAALKAGVSLQDLAQQMQRSSVSYPIDVAVPMRTAIALQKALHGSQEINRLKAHRDQVAVVRYSPNGQYLASASGGNDRSLILWRPNGEKIWSRQLEHPVADVIFRPGQRQLVSLERDRRGNAYLKLWSLDGQLQAQPLSGQPIFAVDASPDGRQLAIATPYQPLSRRKQLISGGILLWDYVSPTPSRLRGINANTVTSLRFGAQSDTLITLENRGDNRQVQRWQLQGNQARRLQRYTFSQGEASLAPLLQGETHLATSANGQLMALGDWTGRVILSSPDDRVIAHLGPTGKRISPEELSPSQEHRVRALSFSPDHATLAIARGDGRVDFVDTQNFSVTARPLHPASLNSLSFHPQLLPVDGGYGLQLATASDDFSVRLWQLPRPRTGHRRTVNQVHFSPSGTQIISAGFDGYVKLQQTPNGNLVEQIDLQGEVKTAQLSPSGQLAIGDASGSLHLQTGASRQTIQPYSAGLSSLDFRPDGQQLAIASNINDEIQIWQVHSTAARLRSLPGHRGGVSCLEYSSRGNVLASAGYDGTIKLWNAATGDLIRTFVDPQIATGHEGIVRCISFSPDGQLLASGGEDRTVKLWNVAAGNLMRVLEGHTGTVNAVKFSHGGAFVISGGSDKALKVWSVDTGELIDQMDTLHSEAITTLDVSTDGQILVSADETGKIAVSHLNLRDLFAHACQRVGKQVMPPLRQRPPNLSTLCK